MKAPVDLTKQDRDLKFGIKGLCWITNGFLSPFLTILKTTICFVEKSKFAAKKGSSFLPRKLILGMRDPQDDKSQLCFIFKHFDI